MDEDDNDPAIVYVCDIAATIDTDDLGPFTYGDEVKFNVTVHNQGNSDITNISVQTLFAEGLEYLDNPTNNTAGWSLDNNGLLNLVLNNNLSVGEIDTTCLFMKVIPDHVSNDMSWTLTTEIVEFQDPIIGGVSKEDIDSSPDDDPNNDSGGNVDDETDDETDGDGSGDPDDPSDDMNEDLDEDDHDMEGLAVYDIAMTKQRVNPDAIPMFGEPIEFFFTLTNQGNQPITDIVIVDYVPGSLTDLGSVNDPLWMFANDLGTYIYGSTLEPGDSDTVYLDMIFQAAGSLEDYINYSEVMQFSDLDGNVTDGNLGSIIDSDSTPDIDNTNDNGGEPNFPNDISGTDNTIVNENGDEDDHDPELIGYVDLALVKTLVSENRITQGNDVTYRITITNQGTIPSGSITVVDYIPNGLMLDDDNWTLGVLGSTGSSASIILSASNGILPSDGLQFGESVSVDITLRVEENTPAGTYVNYAEILTNLTLTGGDITDIDIDSEAGNDISSGGGDPLTSSDNSIIGNGTGAPLDSDSLTDEDDHDPAIICVPPKPVVEGDLFVCPLEIVTYDLVSPINSDFMYEWRVEGPASIINSTNSSITLEFENEPGGIVKLFMEETTNYTFCNSVSTTRIEIEKPIALSCNGSVNMTLSTVDCEVELNASFLLENELYNSDSYTIQITDSAGNLLSTGLLDGSMLGQDLTYSVIHDCFGNSCWGTLNLEDKSDPVIDCEICPVVDGMDASDYDPECVLTCYEQPILQLRYDDGLRDDLIDEDYEDFIEDALSDNCGNYNEDQVSFYDQYENLGDCAGTRLTRTWSVGFTRADGSEGSVSCTRQYFFQPLNTTRATTYDTINGEFIIEPKEDSLVLPPNIIELPCGVDISPEGIASFFDNPLTEDRDTDDNNVDPDELDVDLVVEFNEGFAWAYPHYYQDGIGSGGPHAQKIDTEICNLISSYTDTEIEACALGCAGNRKVLREWVVLDWCTSEFVEYSQIIKSTDTRGPELSLNDALYSVDPWNCTVDALLPAPEHLNDDCDNDVTYYIGNTGGYDVTGDYENGYTVVGLPLGEHTIEYKSEDCCGNVGTSTMTVTVIDETAPVAVSKEFIVLSLSNIGNQVDEFQGFAKIYAEDVDNGSYDGCTDVTLELRRTPLCDVEDAEWGSFVTFCCEDLEGSTQAEIDVELKITDENGNYNIVWTTVLLEDKAGTVPSIPSHMFLTCDMDYNDFSLTGGFPRFFGACGESVVECDTMEVIENTEPRELRLSDGVIINGIPQVAPAYDPSCGFGAIRRQFRDCGGGEQWFVIRAVDPFDDSTITFPEDVVVDCDDYEIGMPTWEEATCNLVGVSMESDTFMFEDDACFKILNHWSVINWCVYDPSNPTLGGRYDHTQVIKIVDTQDPILNVVDSLCFAVDIDCISKDIRMSGSAIDAGDCGSDWISWEVSIDAYADWTEDFNYSTTNPRFLPNGDPNPYYLPKTGNGEEVSLTLPDNLPSSKIWHRSVWAASDGCGNRVTATRYFQITDKKAPTPYCLNISTAVMTNGEVELWAIDFNQGSFDNCSDSDKLLYTFTDVAPPSRRDEEYDSNDDLMWYNGTFWYYNSEEVDLATGAGKYETQNDFGDEVHRWEPGLRSAGKIFTIDDADANGFAQIPIYVWDECGNYDFCVVNLRIVDNGGGGMAMVAGQIVTELGEEVEEVETKLRGPLNFNEGEITNEQGIYEFSNTPVYQDYVVSGEKNDDYLNGISTLDLVLIQRHILGLTQLDSPYKRIAADVNNDGQITAIDLIELRKLILGLTTEFADVGSWIFVNADQILNIENPWTYESTRTISDLSNDMMNEDFIGVKIGDVNGSVIANVQSVSNESRSSDKVVLKYENLFVRKDDVIELNLTTDRSDLIGFQFTLNTKGLELMEVHGRAIKSENVGVFENKLTVSYNEQSEIGKGELLRFVMKATESGRLSEMIDLGSSSTRAEAYVGQDLNVLDIALEQDNATNEIVLYQNEPNPFTDYTVIGFELPKESQVTISLYDISGKVFKVIEDTFTKGYNKVIINKDDMSSGGLIYFKLESGEFVDTKHMIFID